jgi:two-component system response regulator ResD
MKTVLVVDDEEKIRDVIISYLKSEGFLTLEAATGNEALHILKNQTVGFVILDLMLPDLSGEEVCQSIRKISSVPILMLTAKVSQNNRIHGLSIGADDYLIKPFDPREVLARVRAILRRSDEEYLLADRITFNNGHLEIDSLEHSVFCEGIAVNLTPNEYKLLLALAKYPQRHFTREELVEKVLGYDFEGDIRTIDQHVKNIRQKIECDPRSPQYIVTVYGYGYRFMGDTK